MSLLFSNVDAIQIPEGKVANIKVNGTEIWTSNSWDGKLYDAGNEYTAITGGWVNYGNPTSVTKSASTIVFKTNTPRYVYAGIATANMIPVGRFTRLRYDITRNTSGTDGMWVFFLDENGDHIYGTDKLSKMYTGRGEQWFNLQDEVLAAGKFRLVFAGYPQSSYTYTMYLAQLE